MLLRAMELWTPSKAVAETAMDYIYGVAKVESIGLCANLTLPNLPVVNQHLGIQIAERRLLGFSIQVMFPRFTLRLPGKDRGAPTTPPQLSLQRTPVSRCLIELTCGMPRGLRSTYSSMLHIIAAGVCRFAFLK